MIVQNKIKCLRNTLSKIIKFFELGTYLINNVYDMVCNYNDSKIKYNFNLYSIKVINENKNFCTFKKIIHLI